MFSRVIKHQQCDRFFFVVVKIVETKLGEK